MKGLDSKKSEVSGGAVVGLIGVMGIGLMLIFGALTGGNPSPAYTQRNESLRQRNAPACAYAIKWPCQSF